MGQKIIFEQMIGDIFIYLIIFIIRGSDSITLLSCNSDAQANDNVNSDIKVSTYKTYYIIRFPRIVQLDGQIDLHFSRISE